MLSLNAGFMALIPRLWKGQLLFPDVCLGGWPGMCAAPMGMMAADHKRTGGDVLAAWAEGPMALRLGGSAACEGL